MRKLETYKTFILPIISGLLLSLTLAPWNIRTLVWISFVPFFLFIFKKNISTKEKLKGAFLTGFIYFLTVLWPLVSLDAWWWIPPNTWIWEYRVFLWTLCIVILAIYLTITTFVLFTLSFLFLEQKKWSDFFIFPIIWASIETIRTYSVFGLGWGNIGYNLYNTAHIAYLSYWINISGLAFFIIYINLSISYVIQTYISTKKINYKILISAVSVFLIVLVGGYFTIKNYIPPKERKSVALISINKKTEHINTPEIYANIFKLTKEAAEKKNNIVVLPENTFPLFVLDEKTKKPDGYNIPQGKIAEMFDELIKISSDYNATSFIIGMHTQTNEKNYNSLVVLEGGKIVDIYHKRRPLPLSESVPSFLQSKHSEIITKGNADKKTVFTSGIETIPLICSEIISTDLGKNKQKTIINISNDSVFANNRGEKYNQSIARMRAIENRSFVIRSEKKGTSLVINPFGKIITPLEETDILYSQINTDTSKF